MNLNEQIREIKKLIGIMENTKLGSNVLIMGDKIAKYLKLPDFEIIDSLIDEDMTVDLLIDRISEQELNEKIEEIFLSIGSNDLFDPNNDIGGLVSKIYDFFPNSRLHLIKGYVNTFEFGLDEDEIDEVKEDAVTFFELFKKEGIKIIGGEITGKMSVVGNDIIKLNSTVIEKLKNYILGFVFNFEIKDTAEVETVVFSDLDIDEKTDFDTIYEFLDLFEKIVKSNNTYSENIGDRYIGEVEMIQIALAFLGYENEITINGKYDSKTKNAVFNFQRKNNLSETGIANKETLTEILWELKANGFEEDDLGKFLNDPSKKKKQYEVDSYDLKSYCDEIIDGIEGGYANESHFKASAEKTDSKDMKKALLNSSETMYGMDRVGGNWDSHPVGKDFWQLIDENSGWAEESADKPKWTHGYMGGSLESKLRSYVYDMMIPIYEDLKGQYLDSETKKLVEEDKRLVLHFLYACWNGSDFFRQFADTLNSEVSSGNTDRDSLYEIAINSRLNHSNDVIRKTGQKLKGVIESL
jgi:hypothetical protein